MVVRTKAYYFRKEAYYLTYLVFVLLVFYAPA
jgi:hypothetical protein